MVTKSYANMGTNEYLAMRRLIEERHHYILSLLLAKDIATWKHSVLVGELLGLFCGVANKDFGLPMDLVSRAGAMHDAGKLTMPDNILKGDKRYEPGSAERKIIEEHPVRGLELVKDLPLAVRRIVALHHQRYDREGYPRIKDDRDLPEEAMVASVVDVAVALMEARPYKKEKTIAGMLRIIKADSGKAFSPRIVKEFEESLYLNQKNIDHFFLSLMPKSVANMQLGDNNKDYLMGVLI